MWSVCRAARLNSHGFPITSLDHGKRLGSRTRNGVTDKRLLATELSSAEADGREHVWTWSRSLRSRLRAHESRLRCSSSQHGTDLNGGSYFMAAAVAFRDAAARGGAGDAAYQVVYGLPPKYKKLIDSSG